MLSIFCLILSQKWDPGNVEDGPQLCTQRTCTGLHTDRYLVSVNFLLSANHILETVVSGAELTAVCLEH